MAHPWYRYAESERVLTLSVHVQPNAKRSGLAGVHGDALKVRIAAPAVDSKANAALLAYIAALLDVPAGAVRLRRGARSRGKTLEIRGAGAEAIARIERALSG
jgi:uncharacterized protein (TIGR00251 family)